MAGVTDVKTLLSDTEGSMIQKEALEKLIEIIFEAIAANKVNLIDEIPLEYATEEEIPADAVSKVPTVLAVYRAVKKVGHIYLRFVKSEDGKTFEEMQADKTPEEMCFYVFKDSTDDASFDLYFYDSQQGKYVNIGSTSFDPSTINLDNYWSKDELVIDTLKTEITEAVIAALKEQMPDSPVVNMDEYVRKDEVEVITPDQVQEMWDAVVAKHEGGAENPSV